MVGMDYGHSLPKGMCLRRGQKAGVATFLSTCVARNRFPVTVHLIDRLRCHFTKSPNSAGQRPPLTRSNPGNYGDTCINPLIVNRGLHPQMGQGCRRVGRLHSLLPHIRCVLLGVSGLALLGAEFGELCTCHRNSLSP